MMGKTRLMVGFNIRIICMFLLITGAGSSREDLIQDSVRRLLGVKPGSETSVVPGPNATLPPQYLMDLYEKYRSGHTPMQGNTVRSILPMRDPMGDGEVLIFNLTSINPNEHILQSKLYLLKRKKAKSGRKKDLSDFRIQIGTLPQMTSHRYINVSLPQQKSEWHAYDITESVVLGRQSKKQNHLLGVTLEVKRPNGSYRLVHFRRLLKHNSQPFVLIFSEDNTNQSRRLPKPKRKGSRIRIHDLLSVKVNPDTLSDGEAISSEHILRRKRSFISNTSYEILKTDTFKNSYHEISGVPFGNINSSYNFFSHEIQNSFSNNTKTIAVHGYSKFLSQKLSSKQVNELEESVSERFLDARINILPKVLFKNVYRLPKHFTVSKDNGTKGLSIYRKHRVSKRSVSTSLGLTKISHNSKEKSIGENSFQIDSDKFVPGLISGAEPLPRRQNRQRNGKKHKKKKGNRKFPFWWTSHDKNLHLKDFHKICQKKSLVVDFEKLGWGDWIMSPKSFNAYYCSGGCSFPVIKDANPSNHAAIQSLVHAMRLGPNLPAPCCVPSETKPLTLLYFDENNSLVLKNYPNMIVEKCACR